MNIKQVLATINQMQADGVIDRYAECQDRLWHFGVWEHTEVAAYRLLL